MYPKESDALMVLIGMFMIANTSSFLFNLDSSTISNELANFTMAGEISNNEVLLQFNQVKHHLLISQLDAWWLNTKKPKLYFSMKLLFECLSSSPFRSINLILFFIIFPICALHWFFFVSLDWCTNWGGRMLPWSKTLTSTEKWHVHVPALVG